MLRVNKMIKKFKAKVFYPSYRDEERNLTEALESVALTEEEVTMETITHACSVRVVAFQMDYSAILVKKNSKMRLYYSYQKKGVLRNFNLPFLIKRSF